jgi:hypothetical protein
MDAAYYLHVAHLNFVLVRALHARGLRLSFVIHFDLNYSKFSRLISDCTVNKTINKLEARENYPVPHPNKAIKAQSVHASK